MIMIIGGKTGGRGLTLGSDTLYYHNNNVVLQFDLLQEGGAINSGSEHL